jgi:hypothetical protein
MEAVRQPTSGRRRYPEQSPRPAPREKQSPYWRKRLEQQSHDAIISRTGYAKDAPEMLLEFRGLRRFGRGRDAYYAIRLGRVLKIRRWGFLLAQAVRISSLSGRDPSQRR